MAVPRYQCGAPTFLTRQGPHKLSLAVSARRPKADADSQGTVLRVGALPENSFARVLFALLTSLMSVMQELGKLLAEAFIPLAAMADNYGMLEELSLNVLGERIPEVDDCYS